MTKGVIRSDSTHILDFHGRIDSDSRVKFDSRLMSRAQPCPEHLISEGELARGDVLGQWHDLT